MAGDALQPDTGLDNDKCAGTSTRDDSNEMLDALSALALNADSGFVLQVAAGRTCHQYDYNNYDNKDNAGMQDAASARVMLYDVKFDSPPPERQVPARGSDDGNKTYFTRRPVCRIECTINDASVLESVTQKMLGPGTDFGVVCIDVVASAISESAALRLLANITNSVQTPDSGVRMGMVIVDVLNAVTLERADSREIMRLARPA